MKGTFYTHPSKPSLKNPLPSLRCIRRQWSSATTQISDRRSRVERKGARTRVCLGTRGSTTRISRGTIPASITGRSTSSIPRGTKRAFSKSARFSTLFLQYREKYLQEAWPIAKSALKEHGITGELNLVDGCMTVSTTMKMRDPYIILKARDLLRLLSRSVPAPQTIKKPNDGMECDIIKISNIVRNKERFVKRRQHLVGPNSSTLKGNTVAGMGSFKGLKQVRRIVEDWVENKMHPGRTSSRRRYRVKRRKNTHPFPPPQQPRKIDIQLVTVEYFLSDKKKFEKKWREKQDKQAEKTAETKRKREAAFVPPEESVTEERGKSTVDETDVVTMASSLKVKRMSCW
ncbi:KRR1 small subunit processome component-like protein [Drosera capensis]